MNTFIDVCAVELAKKLNETSKAFPCSKGANELVAYLVSEKELEKFLMTAKECGFEGVSEDTDEKHIFCTLESQRERMYILYIRQSEELKLIWENISHPPTLDTDKKGEVKVLQLGIGNYGKHTDNPMVGMGYIIKLANSHAIIVDGGFDTEGCADNLYASLEKLEIAKDGEKFIIDAWYITHLDGDHIGILKAFFAKYSDKARIISFVQNFPVGDPAVNEYNYKQIGDDYISLMETTCLEAKIITAHPSEIYSYAGANIKILYTAEMYYSVFSRLMDGNDASLIFTLEANGKKMLFMGDGGEVSARCLYAAYGKDALKCDILQIPHHGLTTGHMVFKRSMCEHAYLDRIYGYASPEFAALPMGETFNRYRDCYGNNQRKWVLENYPQDGYFLDKDRDDMGYNGVNIIKCPKDGYTLTTYMMSSDTEPMATLFGLSRDGVSVEFNDSLTSFLQ